MQFKNETNEKIGFSTFCVLRSKWCVTVGASGTHSVCFCIKHRKAKLMIAAVDKKLYYRDLMAMCVCDVQSKDCMMNHCDQCRNILVLKNFLTVRLRENYDLDDTIPFKKWQTTDRSNLEEVELDFCDFFRRNLRTKSEILQFIILLQRAKIKYFRYAKDNLSKGECVTVLDFAENYSSIVQDAVRGFHWNSFHATIHPFVIHYLVSSRYPPQFLNNQSDRSSIVE